MHHAPRPEGGDGGIRTRTDTGPLAESRCHREERDPPSPPENVALAIEHFIVASERPAVLLDGFEYLVSHNDFGSVCPPPRYQ